MANYSLETYLPTQRDNNEITLGLLGHSTILINMYGKWIITDPILFTKIGVKIGGIKIGMSRLYKIAISVNDILKLDMIILSHAHMDHWDIESLQALVNRFPNQLTIICPKNTTKYLKGIHNIKCVEELDWDEEKEIEGIHFRAGETRHRGARRPWERKKHRKGHPKSPGYNSYLIASHGKQIVFGGDTAYTEVYKNLASNIDVAIMPIGAYDPWIRQHCTPEEAVIMAELMGTKHFIPVHFETFKLDKAILTDPMVRLQTAMQNHSTMSLGIDHIGGIFTLQ